MRQTFLKYSDSEQERTVGRTLYRLAAYPMSLVYRAIVGQTAVCNPVEGRTSYQSTARIIGVGSPIVGGTGKTPLVAHIAQMSTGSGLKTVILTRGYRRRSHVRVVLPPETSAADPALVGDEPAMLASKQTGATIVVFHDRLADLGWIEHELSPDIVLLDDGFSDRRIARDADILMLTSKDVLSKSELLPLGQWRYPPSVIRRAHIIIVLENQGIEQLEEIQNRLTQWGFTGSSLSASYITQGFTDHVSSEMQAHDKSWGSAFAFCGIANPQAFRMSLIESGVTLSGREFFPDHHNYSSRDIERINTMAQSSKAQWLVTTAKDAVKLDGNPFVLPLRVLQIALELDDPDDILRAIIAGGEKRTEPS